MRVCQICKKQSMIQKSGAHQYGGGWAMRATKKRAVWQVNLHKVKVTYLGIRQSMRLCSKCIRRVKAEMAKTISPRHSEPFDEPQDKLREESIKKEVQTPVATA